MVRHITLPLVKSSPTKESEKLYCQYFIYNIRKKPVLYVLFHFLMIALMKMLWEIKNILKFTIILNMTTS